MRRAPKAFGVADLCLVKRSYSMVQAGRDLAATVEKLPGYNPAAADLQPAALKAAMAVLAGHNAAVAAPGRGSRAISDRAALYEAEQTGLRQQFQQEKADVASQPAREHFRSSAAAAPSTKASPASAISESLQRVILPPERVPIFLGRFRAVDTRLRVSTLNW